MAKTPVEITVPERIVKLASGYDFVLFLSETGRVYSCGNGETGQLARLNRYAAEDGLRGGIGKFDGTKSRSHSIWTLSLSL